MTDQLNIPEEAYHPKLFPATFDRIRTAQIISSSIARTGRPYLCPQLTHSRPPKDVPIEYFGLISSLPETHSGPDNADRWAPCPCCRPTRPKFYRDIVLVYFPLEQVIRAMGKYCFAKFNKRYHNEAWKKFQLEEKRKSTLQYLAANIGNVPDMIAQTEYNLPIVEAFDIFRADATAVIDDLYGERLWDNVRTGRLPIERKTTRLNVNRAGEESEQDYVVREFYGPVVGFEMIRPNNTSLLAGRLRTALKGFNLVNIGNGGLNQMSTEHREEALKVFSRSIRQFRDVSEKVDQMRRFTDPVNLATLTGWGKHPGAPMRLFVDFDGNSFFIGDQEHSVRRVVVPDNYSRVLRRLPSISDIAADLGSGSAAEVA